MCRVWVCFDLPRLKKRSPCWRRPAKDTTDPAHCSTVLNRGDVFAAFLLDSNLAVARVRCPLWTQAQQFLVAINLLQSQLQGKNTGQERSREEFMFVLGHMFLFPGGSCIACRASREVHALWHGLCTRAGLVRNQSALAYVMIHISTWNQPGTTMSVIAAGATASSCKRNCCWDFLYTWQRVADGLIPRDSPHRLGTSIIATYSPFNVRAGVTLT